MRFEENAYGCHKLEWQFDEGDNWTPCTSQKKIVRCNFVKGIHHECNRCCTG
jgi:hypothetical protein